MANTNTDLTEEDASDLQFPKGKNSPAAPENLQPPFYSITETDSACLNCSENLEAPYIECAECRINLCTSCFAKGVEPMAHRNDHKYHIIRDDFPLFENTDWTAREEVVLLESLPKCGNWNLVARQLPSRSADEIRRHYDSFYVEKQGSGQLPDMSENTTGVLADQFVPFRFRISDSHDPPRYNANTVGYKSLAGYNAARSDFESEFDSTAEDLLSNLKTVDINDVHYKLLTDLQCGVVRNYNRRLLERQRWKKIIRNHGLIALRKLNAWLHRYDLTITRPVYEKLISFMQFCTPLQFELLMEGLHRSGELKVQILKLCELRMKGITCLADARLYLRLKQVHETCENDLKAFQSNPIFNWRHQNKDLPIDFQSARKRSKFTPIEILGMPGYEKLTPAERDLCRNVRLVPVSYLELKEVLITECSKMGSIKLKTARKILKIDVNKTRRLYDFLVQEGYITKSV